MIALASPVAVATGGEPPIPDQVGFSRAAALSSPSDALIAVHAGVAPRTLQECLSLLRWDHDRMRDRLGQIVAREHAGSHPIGTLDETSDAKKRDKTPGVKRPWCGAVGKIG
jgi:SRSO17 transposase